MARTGLSHAVTVLPPVLGGVALANAVLFLAVPQVRGNLGLVLGWGMASNLLTIAAALVFCFWLSGAYRAAPGPARFSLGWSVGCWFIPAANAVLPYGPALDLVRRHNAGRAPLSAWVWLVGWSVSQAANLVTGVAGGIAGVRAGLAGRVTPDLPEWVFVTAVVSASFYLVAGLGLAVTAARIQDKLE
jgi:hypothetical protein